MVDILSKFPSIIPRSNKSNFKQFVEAHNEEVRQYESDIDYIIRSKQIDNSSGEDLDEIGRFYGPIGRRRDRDDGEYQQYLKSVVQAFSGRGTKPSMESAIALAFNINENDITISENFTDVEYNIEFNDWPEHSTDGLYNIANIVDPSGVEFAQSSYNLTNDSALSSDLNSVDTYTVTGSEWDTSNWGTFNWS